MSAKIKHAINIVSGFLIIWGGWTCIVAEINYICLPVFMLGVVAYMLNNEEGEYVSSTRDRG